jgi:hypothetical protein
LPKVAALAAPATPRAAADAAAPNRISRRDKLLIGCLTDLYFGESQYCGRPLPDGVSGLADNYDRNRLPALMLTILGRRKDAA